MGEGCGDEGNDCDSKGRGHDHRIGAGIIAFGEMPTPLDPAHEAPYEPPHKHSHNDAAQDVARVMYTHINPAIA